MSQKQYDQYLAQLCEQGGASAEFLQACRNNEFERVRVMLSDDPNLARLATGEVTPLRVAVVFGHLELAERLLFHGAPVNAVASFALNTPLHVASANGQCEFIQLLLAHGAEVDAHDRNAITPIHYASKGKSEEAVRLLVEAGANMEHRDRFHRATALQQALCEGIFAMVNELIRLGANVNAETRDQPHMLFRVISEHDWPLHDACEGTRPLHIAVCRGWAPVVNLLLDNGADINALSFGWSALHAAVAIPDVKMVELLVKRGADLHVKADLNSPNNPQLNNRTPMDMLMGYRRSAELLQEAQERLSRD